MNDFLEIFLIAAAFAIVLNVFLKKFQIPTIIGYIFTGLIIKYTLDLSHSESVDKIAEFGVVFLMFTIGLEFSIKHLLKMKNEVFLNGATQVGVSGFVFAVLVFYMFNLTQEASIIVGCALALSSTAIVLKLLNDSGDINESYGRKALGILLFQDIAVIPLLLMIDIFSEKNSSITGLLLKTGISAVVLLSLLFFIGKYLFNRFLYSVVKTGSQEIFISTVLFTVIGASFLANFFGFSYSLGAFIAGMMIAETEYKHQIEADLIPFRDLLLGLFFISVGMQIDISLVLDKWYVIFGLFVAVMIVKIIIIFAIILLSSSKRIALKTAFSICQIGEFALAIFSLLMAKKMIEPDAAQVFSVTTILSMIAAPFILNNIKNLANIVESVDSIEESGPRVKIEGLKNHFVIFGYGRLGQEVVFKLKNAGVPYIVLESDLNLVELGQSRAENVFLGNASQDYTFDLASIKTCAAVIITVSNEQKLELICQKIASYGSDIKTIIRVSGDEKSLFSDLQNLAMVKEERAVARVLVHEALQARIDQNI